MFVGDWDVPDTDHQYADTRPLGPLPNAADVLSNLPLVVIGLIGARRLLTGVRAGTVVLSNPAEVLPWLVLFLGIAASGVGSTWYHLQPTAERLLWDRGPIALSMAAFIGAALTERVGPREGILTLPVLAVAALLTVGAAYQGDLRYYIWLNLVALLVVPLLCRVVGGPYSLTGLWYGAVALYLLAKVAELFDADVYALGQILSGHTLKHLLAAAGIATLVHMVTRRRLLSGPD